MFFELRRIIVRESLSPGCFFLAHLEAFSYIALCKSLESHAGIPIADIHQKEEIGEILGDQKQKGGNRK